MALSTDGSPVAPSGTRLDTHTHMLKETAEPGPLTSYGFIFSSHTLTLYASSGIALIAKTNHKLDHSTQLHKHKQTPIYKVVHRERTHSIFALGAWVHSNNPVVNVLLSGSQRGSLTMCTFRTQSPMAAQSLWRKSMECVPRADAGPSQRHLYYKQTNSALCYGHQPWRRISRLLLCPTPARALVEIYWPTPHSAHYLKK